MPFDPIILHNYLPTFQNAPEQPAEAFSPYLKLYGLERLENLASHRIGLINGYGTPLCCQCFTPSRPSRGTVVLIHGYMEHLALQQPLIQYLLTEGYTVIGYDLPGHGLSEGQRFWIDSFTRYGCQFGEVVQSLHDQLPSPWFFVGHSTGAAVLMVHQQQFGEVSHWPLARRIFLAPLVRPQQYGPIRFKYRWLKYLLNNVARYYSANSHDKQYLEFVREKDPLQHDRIPLDWIGAMLSWIRRIESSAPMHCPVTVIQGLSDGTVDWVKNLSTLNELYPQLQIELIEDARHQLINESSPYQKRLFRLLQHSMQQHHQHTTMPAVN
ncbi:MAG: alpha/beta hydrolase [Marinobacterium sp.]|nr:alpha/beta hydrolase [Marinobacterium sp.]